MVECFVFLRPPWPPTFRILLTETTPVATSPLIGGAAILTSIGFLLPDSAVIAGENDGLTNVTIATGSSSVGFSGGDLAAGGTVSAEWGATIGGRADIGNGTSWDFVSALTAHVSRFNGTNRDSTTALDGPQGGLLNDSAARGGKSDRSHVVL